MGIFKKSSSSNALIKQKEAQFKKIDSLAAPHHSNEFLQSMKANWLGSRAEWLLSKGQVEDAQSDIQEALSLDPNNPLIRSVAASVQKQANLG